MRYYALSTPFGLLPIVLKGDRIWQIELKQAPEKKAEAAPAQVQAQFDAYFANPQHHFELPLHTRGTDFQQRVWQALKTIPPGKAYSYKTLAETLDSHPRAIGQACKANPFPIVVPCHRVVAQNSLGGFAGHTQGDLLKLKGGLLQHEGYSEA